MRMSSMQYFRIPPSHWRAQWGQWLALPAPERAPVLAYRHHPHLHPHQPQSWVEQHRWQGRRTQRWRGRACASGSRILWLYTRRSFSWGNVIKWQKLTPTNVSLLADSHGKGLGAHLALLWTGDVLRHKEVVIEDVQFDALPPTVLPLVGLRVWHNVVSE